MKTTLLIAFGLFLGSLCLFSADVANPPNSISFTNVHLIQVLEIYKLVSGFELVTDSHVKRVPHQITLEAHGVETDKAVKLLEKALLEQAGVVITRLDDKRASVTYNDALPITNITTEHTRRLKSPLH